MMVSMGLERLQIGKKISFCFQSINFLFDSQYTFKERYIVFNDRYHNLSACLYINILILFSLTFLINALFLTTLTLFDPFYIECNFERYAKDEY